MSDLEIIIPDLSHTVDLTIDLDLGGLDYDLDLTIPEEWLDLAIPKADLTLPEEWFKLD